MSDDPFTERWLASLREEWNRPGGLGDELEKIGFDSVVAFGLPDEDAPRACLVIRAGHIVEASAGDCREAEWDIRASRAQWLAWLREPPGLLAIGMAFTSGALSIRRGDYAAMIKDPVMAEMFVTSFAVMSRAYRNQCELPTA